MKGEFTRKFMTSNRGCYSREQMLNVKCVKENNITLENLFNDLPIKDFCWFFVRKCELTIEQKQRFSLHCAKSVLYIFEKEHPKDKRIRECIDAKEQYIDGNITKEELEIKQKRAAAVYVYDTANANAYASAAANAYAAAIYAYDVVYAYAAAAADAYDADDAFGKTVWEFVLEQ